MHRTGIQIPQLTTVAMPNPSMEPAFVRASDRPEWGPCHVLRPPGASHGQRQATKRAVPLTEGQTTVADPLRQGSASGLCAGRGASKLTQFELPVPSPSSAGTRRAGPRPQPVRPSSHVRRRVDPVRRGHAARRGGRQPGDARSGPHHPGHRCCRAEPGRQRSVRSFQRPSRSAHEMQQRPRPLRAGGAAGGAMDQKTVRLPAVTMPAVPAPIW